MGEKQDFGAALVMLRDGRRVARDGWNGKGMFIFLINGTWAFTDGKQDNFPCLPFIAMKTAQDEVVPWLASQTDILADDWMDVTPAAAVDTELLQKEATLAPQAEVAPADQGSGQPAPVASPAPAADLGQTETTAIAADTVG